MDFCTSYFGKPLTALTYHDIAAYFIEPRIEGTTFEFKSFHPSSTIEKGLDGVIVAICSFLNSEGGILIWGAPQGEKQAGGKEKVFTGELCPVPQLIEKDRLINRITSEITRPPIGIKVQILPNHNGYVYVFEVQESLTKPHQFDSQYYIRLDGQSRPAPHYIVEALMRQVTYPNLCGVIKFHPMERDFQIAQYIHMPISIGMFNFSELQNEESVSFRLLCVGGYFPAGKAIIKGRTNPAYSHDGCELVYDNFVHVLHFGTPVMHNNEIIFTPKTLKETGGKLDLLLSFGGKKSPAKMSHYTFSATILPNFYCELTGCNENTLFAENSNSLNKTMADSLQTFTGR